MVLPFSVFSRAGRPHFYVAFKNEKTGRYLSALEAIRNVPGKGRPPKAKPEEPTKPKKAAKR